MVIQKTPTKIDKIVSLRIGQHQENAATQIKMDVSDWITVHPTAVFHILFKRPGEVQAQPVLSSLEEGILTWTVQEWETSLIGVGYAEVRAIEAESALVAKSRVIPCSIEESVIEDGEVPPEYSGWVERVLTAAETVETTQQDYEETVESLEQAIADGIEDIQAEGTTQVGAVQAKGTEVLNSIPSDYTELSDDVTSLSNALNSSIEANFLSGFKTVGMAGSLFQIGKIADAGYNIDATNRIRIVYGSLKKDNKNFVIIPSNTYKIAFYGYSGNLTDNRYFISKTNFQTCGENVLHVIPNNYVYVRYVIGKIDDSDVSQSDIDYIAENIIRYDISTDSTLTKEQSPADAKAVGDAISDLPTIRTNIANNESNISNLGLAFGDYVDINNSRFEFSINLFDSAAAVNNYYVSNSNGNLIAYNGWFATPFMPVDDSTDYSFIILESGQDWKKPSGVYYAFYNASYNYTHGGVSSTGGNLTPQSGDAYCRVSYYLGAVNSSMFGTATDMDEYIGTQLSGAPYYVAPKYEKNPYKGLISAFVGVSNPYYSLRVSGNRITTSQDGNIEGAFIKFDTITMIAEDGFKTKSWADFKTDIQNDAYIEIATAYDKTPDVLRLLPEYGIVYNYNTNTYHVKNKVYITGLTKHDMVVFYNDANSVPSGVLYDAWSGNHKQGIEKYIRTIESRETGLLNYGSKFVFAFATDCHWYFDDSAYHNYTNEMIEELRKCIGFDCYINGGDSIYYGTKYKLNGIASMRKAFEPEHDDYIYCIGNHDYNGISTGETQNSDWMFSADGIESLCMRKMQNIVRPAGARYYYRDFEGKKIRVIVLDTSDLDITFDDNGNLTSADPLTSFVVRQNQIDWFCDALNCPDSGWGVVIVMHVGLYLAEDGFTDNNPLTNRQAIIKILKAYLNKGAYSYSTSGTYAVSGSGTFANANGSLVGVWSGHAHADGYCNKDGFNAIQTECGYPDSSDRIVGTINEVCVDCVSVDMTNKTIKLKRFGPGSDREYSFT